MELNIRRAAAVKYLSFFLKTLSTFNRITEKSLCLCYDTKSSKTLKKVKKDNKTTTKTKQNDPILVTDSLNLRLLTPTV